MSLISRYLEEQGLPTVIIGTARDIVEHCGVARLAFTDFPLGNPCGEPNDATQQRVIVNAALKLLETAEAPRTTVQSPSVWSQGARWKELIFTEEQPFLEGEAYDNWMAAKANYKKLKEEGKV